MPHSVGKIGVTIESILFNQNAWRRPARAPVPHLMVYLNQNLRRGTTFSTARFLPVLSLGGYLPEKTGDSGYYLVGLVTVFDLITWVTSSPLPEGTRLFDSPKNVCPTTRCLPREPISVEERRGKFVDAYDAVCLGPRVISLSQAISP